MTLFQQHLTQLRAGANVVSSSRLHPAATITAALAALDAYSKAGTDQTRPSATPSAPPPIATPPSKPSMPI